MEVSKVCTFTFNDKDWYSTVQYDSNTQTAQLTALVRLRDGKPYTMGEGYTYIKSNWNKTTIAIKENEYEDEECVNGIYYTLRVVLDEAKKQNEYPWIGRVSVSTTDATKNVKCYIDAFKKVGFAANVLEKIKMKKLIKNKTFKEVDPLIQMDMNKFFSREQANLYEKKYGKGEATKKVIKEKLIVTFQEKGNLKF